MRSMTELNAHLVKKLEKLYTHNEAKSIARIVMEDVFRFYHFQDDRPILEEEEKLFHPIQTRLLKGEPVQYVIGASDFYNIRVKVTPDVLIPRQETEELVHLILQLLKKNPERQFSKVLDIGTGSGCIAISLKKAMPDLEITALDVSQKALEIAKQNALSNETEVNFLTFDILQKENWDQLPKFDIIVSNPPYIPKDEIHLMDQHVLDYEPQKALFVDDSDPLLFYKKISLFGLAHLQKEGVLYFESNAFNADDVVKFMEEIGYKEVIKRKDLNGNDRMISGSLF